MRGRRRIMGAAATVAVVSTAFLLIFGSPASAGPYACRGPDNSFSTWGIDYQTATWTTVVTDHTTNNCNDIQVKLNGGTSDYDYMCVVFINVTNVCNYSTRVPENWTWVNIATTVADNVAYEIRIYLRNGRHGQRVVGWAG